MRFLRLRVDSHAQWEIRAYAEIMAGMMQRVAPMCYEAWMDYEVLGCRMSYDDRRLLSRYLHEKEGVVAPRQSPALQTASFPAHAMDQHYQSRREKREMLDKLQPPSIPPDYSLDFSAMVSAETMERLRESSVP